MHVYCSENLNKSNVIRKQVTHGYLIRKLNRFRMSNTLYFLVYIEGRALLCASIQFVYLIIEFSIYIVTVEEGNKHKIIRYALNNSHFHYNLFWKTIYISSSFVLCNLANHNKANTQLNDLHKFEWLIRVM